MYSIKSFIDTLDDLETLDELVRKNARNHAPRGVGEKQFMVSIGYLFLLCLYFCDLSIYPSCVCIFVIEYLFLMCLYFCNLSIYHSCVCIFVIEFLSLMCLYFCDWVFIRHVSVFLWLSNYLSCVCIFVIEYFSVMCLYFCDWVIIRHVSVFLWLSNYPSCVYFCDWVFIRHVSVFLWLSIYPCARTHAHRHLPLKWGSKNIKRKMIFVCANNEDIPMAIVEHTFLKSYYCQTQTPNLLKP